MLTLGKYLNNDDQDKLKVGIQNGMCYYILNAYFEIENRTKISKEFQEMSINKQSVKNTEQNIRLNIHH